MLEMFDISNFVIGGLQKIRGEFLLDEFSLGILNHLRNVGSEVRPSLVV